MADLRLPHRPSLQQRLHIPHTTPWIPTPSRARSQARGRKLVHATATATSAVATPTTTTSPPTPAPVHPGVSQEAKRSLFGRGVEQVEEVEATVTGTIPSWLSGMVLLNGGADYQPMLHMFDGYGMVSKIRIDKGRVCGSQRYIQTEAFRHHRSTGKMKFREFGTPIPSSSPLERAALLLKNFVSLVTNQGGYSDNASVSVVPLPNGKVLALSESMPSAYVMDPQDLSTSHQLVYQDGFPGVLTTAHPKPLPNGRWINFTRTIPFGGFSVYTQDPGTLERKPLAFIKDRKFMPAWVHDIAVTQRHLVICEPPLYFNLLSLLFGRPTPHVFMDWCGEEPTRVIVVPLDGGEVNVFETNAFFSFHVANAFESEDGSTLHVDLSMYDDPEVLNELMLDRLKAHPGKDIGRSYLRRLSIPLSAPSGTHIPDPSPVIPDEARYGTYYDFPTVNPAVRGQRYRYAYGVGAERPSNMSNALVKIDVEEGTCLKWHEAGCLPGEPIFLAAPGSQSEDEGVLMSTVMGSHGHSFLLLLNAKDMSEIARAQLPYGIPYRFHTAFIPTNATG